ncbi:MAG TPA: NADH-quinone oxidoreductase subunit F, partial [Methylococcaceae bacterium]|nr:NADH-quinone oxidoreductase subunit F [Methylococcaceae bacterium]
MATIHIDADQIVKKKRKGRKGHSVDFSALSEIQGLLGNEPRRSDLLIEHLHKIQDRYHHLSDKHLTALAHEM